MRLQLILALGATGLASAPAAAEPRQVTGALRLYLDDDHTQVVSSSAAGSAALSEATEVRVDVDTDAISSASIDVLSGASPIAMRELRTELGARLTHTRDTYALRGLVRGSYEEDYLALRAGAGLRAELAARTLTFDLVYQAGVDHAGEVTDPTFDRRRRSHELTLTTSRVLDPRTQVDVVVEGQLASGYHASPYRRVPIVAPGMPLPIWVDEQTPSSRRGIAIAAQARRAVGDAWFVAAAYRLYLDDWSMTSHTTSLELRRALGERWLVGAGARGYLQSAASFYQRTYTGDVPAERTRDRTLGAMRSVFASVTADRALGERGAAHAVVACGVLAMWFLDSALQAERVALMTTASMTYDF